MADSTRGADMSTNQLAPGPDRDVCTSCGAHVYGVYQCGACLDKCADQLAPVDASAVVSAVAPSDAPRSTISAIAIPYPPFAWVRDAEHGAEHPVYSSAQVAEHGDKCARAAESRAEYWRQLLVAARPFIEEAATITGYGFYRPANPHDFCPDTESCSDEEFAAHKAACEAYDRGEYTPEKGDGWVTPNLHILRAPWGIGSYSDVVPAAREILDAIASLTGEAS